MKEFELNLSSGTSDHALRPWDMRSFQSCSGPVALGKRHPIPTIAIGIVDVSIVLFGWLLSQLTSNGLDHRELALG